MSQEDLLKHFRTDFKNQIIFTTHSPFMVPSDNIASVRTVGIDPKLGTMVSPTPTGDSRTLFPLQAALGYHLAQTLFVGHSNLIVEGVTDFWILSAVSNHFVSNGKAGLPEEVTITPVGGAGKISYMAALLTSQKLTVLVLLDDEKAGRETQADLVKTKLLTRYNANEPKLHLEHIIPLALDGPLELPESSCQSCERITGRLEQIVLRGSLHGIREHLGLKSREKEGRPTTLPVFAVRNAGENEQRIDIPIEDYPSALLLLVAHEAGIFLPPGGDKHEGMVWAYNTKDISQFVAKYKLHSFAPPALDSFSFMRMVGKIGHAFLTAEMGIGSFQPTLPEMILGKSNDHFRYIGSQTRLPNSKNLHEISIEKPRDHEGQSYLMVRLRLFAKLGAPAYLIAAGIPN